MRPTVFVIRHAKTELNHPSEERIRGYSDVPIDHEGREGLKETAKALLPYAEHIIHMLSSPLQRAMLSAEDSGQEINAKVVPTKELLPWNLGKFTGEKVNEVKDKLNYYQEYPDLKVPGGESYRDFYNRWYKGLTKMLDYAEQHPSEILVAVTHSRNVLALPSILDDTGIGDVPVRGGPGPGSITMIYKDGDEWQHELLYNPGESSAWQG